MATISRVKLAITVDGDSRSLCTVDYTVTFDEEEIRLNLPFREKCFLMAADRWPDGDNTIKGSMMRNGVVTPDGRETLRRQLRKDMPNSALDEDGVGADEIYARVTLKLGYPYQERTFSRNSNEVHIDL
jgi:hypothetical protein